MIKAGIQGQKGYNQHHLIGTFMNIYQLNAEMRMSIMKLFL